MLDALLEVAKLREEKTQFAERRPSRTRRRLFRIKCEGRSEVQCRAGDREQNGQEYRGRSKGKRRTVRGPQIRPIPPCKDRELQQGKVVRVDANTRKLALAYHWQAPQLLRFSARTGPHKPAAEHLFLLDAKSYAASTRSLVRLASTLMPTAPKLRPDHDKCGRLRRQPKPSPCTDALSRRPAQDLMTPDATVQ